MGPPHGLSQQYAATTSRAAEGSQRHCQGCHEHAQVVSHFLQRILLILYSNFLLALRTLAPSREGLEKAVIGAGFSNCAILGDLHAFRAKDLRTKDVEEGLSPIQVTLDQAAHLMDAVTLGTSSFSKAAKDESSPAKNSSDSDRIEAEDYFRDWDSARSELANKYRLGGYPEMADFILAV